MQLHVGQSGIQGNAQRYMRQFDMVELVAQPERLPRISRLKEWREQAPEHFVFSVALPAALAALQDGGESAQAWGYAEKVFRALQAQWWVLQTPTSVTPGAATRKRLEATAARLLGSGQRVAWEPRGVWQSAQALDVASSLGIHLVRDLSREDAVGTDVAYTRLRALGAAARVGAGAAERLAENLADFEEAFVIVEGAGAGRVRQVLHEELAMAEASDAASQEVE